MFSFVQLKLLCRINSYKIVFLKKFVILSSLIFFLFFLNFHFNSKREDDYSSATQAPDHKPLPKFHRL